MRFLICVGNIAGIVTPIIFGYIVAITGNYSMDLLFVGAVKIIPLMADDKSETEYRKHLN